MAKGLELLKVERVHSPLSGTNSRDNPKTWVTLGYRYEIPAYRRIVGLPYHENNTRQQDVEGG